MRFSHYPEYKDSGIDWLGPAPAHWRVKRLRHIALLNPGKGPLRQLPPETEVTFLPMEAVGEDGSLDRRQTKPLGDVIEGYTYLGEHDVAFAKITPCFENGKAALANNLKNELAFATTELTVLRPDVRLVSARYLYRIVTSRPFRELGEASMYGAGGQKRVPDNFARDFAIPLPPPDEQWQIADFLDHETARIDALIGEQQQLIEILQEKRQAAISRAVTKGIDSNTSYRDSGSELFGHIPSHWELRKLKYVSPQITVGIVVEPAKYYVGQGVPALRSINVRQGRIDAANMVHISPEAHRSLSKSEIREGDVVVVRSGQPGTAAVVPAEFDRSNCIDLIIVRKPADGSEWFLSWCLAADQSKRQFSEGSDGAIQQHFNIATASNLTIPWPPKAEQQAIVRWINRELEELLSLVDTAQRQIDLLRERRAALISAAVTGKIDVREREHSTPSTEEALPQVAEEEGWYG